MTEITTLKLHTDPHGAVWYADGMDTPRAAERDFVGRLDARQGIRIRMLGTRNNAPLIAALYPRYCALRKDGILEVASPLVCETEQERDQPEVALYRMRQCLLPPSLGGWHRVTAVDYPSYSMAAILHKTGKVDDHVREVLAIHPAWHDLSFIPTIDRDRVACLLAYILDPRWYVDQQHPERLSKLRMALGLTPSTMQRVSRGTVVTDRDTLCNTVRSCWQGAGRPSDSDMERPSNFLWRRWQHAGGGWQGDLRASHAFISYLGRTWLQQIVAATSAKWDMFLPENLLKGSEIPAYKKHAQARAVA